MPKYITAVEAARRLGVNEKTVRNWVRAGTLDARKSAKNRLDILATDVEVLKRKRDGYRDETPDILLLVARLEDLERKYADLEKKYVELTASVAGKVEKQAASQPARVATAAQARTYQKGHPDGNRAVPVGLPDGTMTAVGFAAEIGMEHSVLEGIIRHGMALGRGKGKDYLEVTKVPHPVRADYLQKFFTPEQQSMARALLLKHRKLLQTEE